VALFDGVGTLVDGELGFATPPVFGVMPPVFGVVWAKAKVLDRTTSAAVAQKRFMAWLRVRAPEANGLRSVTFPPFDLPSGPYPPRAVRCADNSQRAGLSRTAHFQKTFTFSAGWA
jgi:hypothetical protein